jgi:hypothetical protein
MQIKFTSHHYGTSSDNLKALYMYILKHNYLFFSYESWNNAIELECIVMQFCL